MTRSKLDEPVVEILVFQRGLEFFECIFRVDGRTRALTNGPTPRKAVENLIAQIKELPDFEATS